MLVHLDLLVVARGGVEPPTFRFSVGRSYQLSYLANSAEAYRDRREPPNWPRDGVAGICRLLHCELLQPPMSCRG